MRKCVVIGANCLCHFSLCLNSHLHVEPGSSVVVKPAELKVSFEVCECLEIIIFVYFASKGKINLSI